MYTELVKPLVSIVIPTIHRPRLVTRAVRSALIQTVSEIEIIVIVDGPDSASLTALDQVQDRRLRVRPLARNVGLGGAINAGVEMAQGRWIALLDDDDEWLPRKLEIQLKQANRSRYADPIICCRLIARTEAGDLVWPRRYPAPGEALSEYLFCQHDLQGGEGAVLPSSVLTTRALLQRVPWRVGLPRLNDFDWLLRVADAEGVQPEFVPWDDPLVIYHREESRKRIGTSDDWQYCRDWLEASRHLVTERAFASFLLTVASMTAARSKHRKAFWVLLCDAFRQGKPSRIDILAHLIIWLIPSKLRTRIAVLLDMNGWSHFTRKRSRKRNVGSPKEG